MSSGNTRTGIFVATMTGLADMCGEEVENALTSTYGHGEIPDNGQALFAAVEDGCDLAGKSYAIFALGDRTYADTFCAAGDRWDAALTACGASRIVDIERHDASSGTLAEDVAGEWAAGWAPQIG
jgi:MioC protein